MEMEGDRGEMIWPSKAFTKEENMEGRDELKVGGWGCIGVT